MSALLTNKTILHTARAQLAVDLNCSPDDFSKDGFVFCEMKNQPGRRPFPRDPSHFEMYTMGRSVVVSATVDLAPLVRRQLEGKTRDEAFSMPFVCGQGLYFLPDLAHLLEPFPVAGYTFRVLEREEIPSLYVLEGFRYTLQYDPNHPRPDALCVVAYQGDAVAGIAGCTDDCAQLWQVGIDVLPEHRQAGLAVALVARLTQETLARAKVPYYGAATPNVASQRVAYRVGFAPAWTCAYRGRFDGALTQPSG